MAAMDTVTEISTLVLAELDFEIPCGHSSHNREGSFHSGPAQFVAMVLHDCTARPGLQGEKYPCCAKWAAKVTEHQDQLWTCPVCGDTMYGSDMVRILGPLNT
jgi:hypothetical protein